MTAFTLEYGGGLGDMLAQMYERGSYSLLETLGEGDHATVHLVCHNPSAPEVFTHHPNRDRMTVLSHGYWSPEEDGPERRKRGMPSPGCNYQLPARPWAVTYYPHPSDTAVLEAVTSSYLVLAPSAGQPDRTLPPECLDLIYDYLLEHTPFQLVVTGCSYDRDGRYEPPVPAHPRIINAVDRLSVPGAGRLLQRAAGLITAHSALCMVGWLEHKPQLLLYPQHTLNRHAKNNQYDQWLFGATRASTVHGLFDTFSTAQLAAFVQHL